MPEISVSEKILSEDYADLILPVTLSGSYFLNAYMQMGGELLGGNYGVIHVPLSSLPRDLLAYVGYYNIPKLYTLLDESSLEASGILKVRSQPLLGYTGKDIILGFLDTGIDRRLRQPLLPAPRGGRRLPGNGSHGRHPVFPRPRRPAEKAPDSLYRPWYQSGLPHRRFPSHKGFEHLRSHRWFLQRHRRRK